MAGTSLTVTPKIATRDKVNWILGKQLWRTGAFTAPIIAHRIGTTAIILNRYAAKNGWQQDLSDRFQIAVQNRLAEQHLTEYKDQRPAGAGQRIPRSSSKYNEEQEIMIQGAAQAAVSAVQGHRGDLRRLGAITRTLMERMEAVLEGEPIVITKKDGTDIEAPLMGARQNISDVAETISRILTRLQGLERVAYGLDEKTKGEGIPLQYVGADDRNV
jgi:hypothetical protein